MALRKRTRIIIPNIPPGFDFLALPAELRLMIYKRIPTVRVQREVQLRGKHYASNTVTVVALVPASNTRRTCSLMAREWPDRPTPNILAPRNPLSHLIVRPEVLPLLSSKYGFLAKACVWSKELQQNPRIRLNFDAFKEREKLHGQDPWLLDWIDIAERMMLQHHRHKRIEIVIERDPNTSVLSHSDFVNLLYRPEVIGSPGPMTKRHELMFIVHYLPPPLSRQLFSLPLIFSRPLYRWASVYRSVVTWIMFHEWREPEWM
jgi:hypothetical protein